MNNASRNFTCEFIGTFALTFLGAGSIILNSWNGAPGLVGIAMAHGLALAIAVSATMNISGGHINPAVTVAMIVTRRIAPASGVLYIIAQCLGATVAGLLLNMLFRGLPVGAQGITGADAIVKSMLGTPNFGTGISVGMVVVFEIILTFLLLFAVFGTAVDPRAPHIGGFGIGLTVAADILAAGPITGAAMNPARTLGPLLAGGSVTTSLWSQHWVYWVGPVGGAVLAALIYDSLILQKGKER